MNLFHQIVKGKELIRNGKTLGKNVKTLEERVNGMEEILKRDIGQMKLSEMEKQEIVIKIYSDVLCSELWLCSNEELSAQVQHEHLGTVCYTVSEMINIIKLNPGFGAIQTIHEAKAVFQGSHIIKWSDMEQNHEM